MLLPKQWPGTHKGGAPHRPGRAHLLPDVMLRASHHVVAGFARVSAGRAHVVVALEAARQEQVGVRDDGGCGTLQLAVGFGERPEPVLQAGQPRAQS